MVFVVVVASQELKVRPFSGGNPVYEESCVSLTRRIVWNCHTADCGLHFCKPDYSSRREGGAMMGA